MGCVDEVLLMLRDDRIDVWVSSDVSSHPDVRTLLDKVDAASPEKPSVNSPQTKLTSNFLFIFTSGTTGTHTHKLHVIKLYISPVIISWWLATTGMCCCCYDDDDVQTHLSLSVCLSVCLSQDCRKRLVSVTWKLSCVWRFCAYVEPVLMIKSIWRCRSITCLHRCWGLEDASTWVLHYCVMFFIFTWCQMTRWSGGWSCRRITDKGAFFRLCYCFIIVFTFNGEFVLFVLITRYCLIAIRFDLSHI